MPHRFGAQHIANGYAAMGGNLARPAVAGGNKSRGSVAAAIEAEAKKAARMLAAKGKKK